MTTAVRLLVALAVTTVSLQPAPALAQVVVVPGPPVPGPFGAGPDPAPAVDTGPGVELAPASTDARALTEPQSDPTPQISPVEPAAATGSEGAPEVPRPPAGINSSSVVGPGLGSGSQPIQEPAVGPFVTGPGVLSLQVGVPSQPEAPVESPAPGTRIATSSTNPDTAANSVAARADWLKRVLPVTSFWAWLLELLPLILQAMLAGLAALISAWALPPGGVVWRLPPELTHQFSSVHQAHTAVVHLADAALALILALVGLGHIFGPRAGVPVLSPRELAPRLAVAVLVSNGSLAIGGWAIGLHNALLLMVTPASLVDWDPGSWLQAGPGGLLFGLVYAILGLMLALGGWLRLALVDVLLVAAPLLAVVWVLPLTAGWGEWALGLFGNLLAGQWLQVLTLWLGAQLLSAPAADLQAAAGKDFAALAVLLVALRLPGLLPGPRGVGALGYLLGAALVGRAGQAVWRAGEDRLLMDYLRRKELDLEFDKVAAAVPDDPPRPEHRQRSTGRRIQSIRRPSAGGSSA